MICQNCGHDNTPDARICSSCGISLAFDEPLRSRDNRSGKDGSQRIESRNARVELYKAIVGSSNREYYVEKFIRYDKAGRAGLSWNWPAFFVTFFWLLYRKMWGWAALYFFLPYLFQLALVIVIGITQDSSHAVYAIAFLGLTYLALYFLAPPLLANGLYYRHCKKKIRKARSAHSDFRELIGYLSGSGGTSNILVFVLSVFFFVAFLGILAAIALPAYQDYTMRTKAREALAFASPAQELVAEYVYRHGAAPDSLEEAGFHPGPLPPTIREMGIASNGVIHITLNTGNENADGDILLVPSLDRNDRITWSCQAPEIRDSYLPAECRDLGRTPSR